MTSLFSGLVLLLAEFGAGAAVIKMRDLDTARIGRLNGLAVATGIVAFCTGIMAAKPLAGFFGRPELQAIVMVSSIGFLVTSLQTVPSALLQRELRFRLLATIEFTSALILAGLVLVGALMGFGYWALVFPSLIAGLITTTWLRSIVKVPISWPALGQIREAAQYSTWVFLGRVGGYLFVSSDFLIVGRVLGESALGSYQFSWTLANTPNDQVNGLVARVSGSFYSAVQHDRTEVARLYRNFLSSVSLLSVPMVLGLAVVAPEFVHVVLGPQWESAIRPLQILCVLNAARVVSILAAPVLQMIGEVRFQALTTLLGLAYMPGLFYAGAKYLGADGVAFAWLLGYPPLLFLIARRTSAALGIGLVDVLQSIAPAIISGTGMIAAVLLLRMALPPTLGQVLHLALMIGVGVTTYAGLMMLFFREQVTQLTYTIRAARG